MGTRMLTWLLLIGYLSIQLGIGYYISKRIKNDQDYYLGGRSIGYVPATFSIFATWFGAETCIGSSAAVFSDGLAGSKADPFGYTLCLVLAGYFLASQLWKKNITTLGDLFRARYSVSVEKIAVMVIIPSSLIWAAAQMQAFGHILSVVTKIDTQMALVLATVIVVAYTSLGGLLADVVNDVLQGSIVIIGLVAVLFFAIFQMGGVEASVQAIASQPEKLSFRSPDESLLAQMDTWFIPILGSLIAQEMISRILATRNPQIARRATLSASLVYFFVGCIPIILGLLGTSLVSGELPHDEHFLPALAQILLPNWMFIIFSGAIIAAIMSTVDSALLAVSAYTTHNLLGPAYQKLSAKKQVATARGVLIVSGVVAFVIAFSGEGVYALVEMASSFGAAGVLIVTFGGLWTKNFAGPKTAGATLIAGCVLNLAYQYVFELEAPFLTSIASALIIYLVGGFFESYTRKQHTAAA